MEPVQSFILALFLLSGTVSSLNDVGIEESKNSLQARQQQEHRTIMADRVHVGMNMDELVEAYNDAELVEKPVYKYGIDGVSNGLLVKHDDKPVLFAWTLKCQEKIHGIVLLSDQITIDENVHVGMTAQDFVSKYPDSDMNIDLIDSRYEFIYVANLKYRVEFKSSDSNRVAQYRRGMAEPESIGLARPNARIDRISIY